MLAFPGTGDECVLSGTDIEGSSTSKEPILLKIRIGSTAVTERHSAGPLNFFDIDSHLLFVLAVTFISKTKNKDEYYG